MPPDKQVADAIRKTKIRQIAKSIRKKYLTLKLGKSEEDEALNKLFQPVATPLKQIVSQQQTNQQMSSIKPEIKIQKKEDTSEFEEPVESFTEEPVAHASFVEPDDDVFANPFNFTNRTLQQHVEQYPRYVHNFIKEYFQKNKKIDKVYGPFYDVSSYQWLLGSKIIEFAQKHLSVEGELWKPTRGLLHLIFYSDPQEYTETDKESYKKLLEITSVHKDSRGRLKSSKTVKYIMVIKPMFMKLATPPSFRTRSAMQTSTPRFRSQSATFEGTGMLYNTRPMEYVYWDDPNELVDRLKLLIASQKAGNTSHNNEIIAIINELKEENIICD